MSGSNDVGSLDDLDCGFQDDAGGDVASDVIEMPVPVAANLHPNFVAAPAPVVNPVDLQIPADEPEVDRDGDLLYFDLETIPDHAREHLFGLEPLKKLVEVPTEQLQTPEEFCSQDLKAAERYLEGDESGVGEKMPPESWLDAVRLREGEVKKPRKGMFDLLNRCDERRAAIVNAIPSRIKQLSTTPEYCRILSIAYAVGNGPVECMTADTDELEPGILKRFWELAEGRRLVVFNGLGFDIPVLLVRSAILGVKPPRLISTSPYGNREVLDLMRVRFVNQIPTGWGLKKLARVYGIEVPAGDVNGSRVYEMFQAGQFDQIKEYNKSDVVILREFHRKLRGRFCG